MLFVRLFDLLFFFFFFFLFFIYFFFFFLFPLSLGVLEGLRLVIEALP